MTLTARGLLMDGYGNNLFASKTGYFWTHPKKTPQTDEMYRVIHNGQKCKAIQFNLVSRHAARYTSIADMYSFTNLQNKIKSNYRNSNFSFISTWVNNYPRNKDSSVSELGVKEMQYLGMKYAKSLHTLFSGQQKRTKLVTSSKTRTKTSGLAFINGMNNEYSYQNPAQVMPVVDEKVTRFYEDCTNYESRVAENKTFMHEMYDFQISAIFQKMIDGIVKNLGMNRTLSAGKTL